MHSNNENSAEIFSSSNHELSLLLETIRLQSGIDFSHYRRSMLTRRISARMATLGHKDIRQYHRSLIDNRTECDLLVDAIAINVSSFFRDKIVYGLLEKEILPELIERKQSSKTLAIRAWSAGCASGEEPYSLAILLQERLKRRIDPWELFLFGTDIDQKSLQRAATALYPRERLEQTPLGIVDRYFAAEGDEFRLNDTTRAMIHFSHNDLTSAQTAAPGASIFGDFDLVFCRNLLIYFDLDLQALVLKKLIQTLAPGGYLILGEAETPHALPDNGLKVIDRRHRIYQKILT